MKDTYLEVTFRHGQPLAAYYYLPRRPSQRSHRTEEIEPGILVDYARGGKPIGIEMTSPRRVNLAMINRVLRRLGQAELRRVDFAPLRAA